MTLSLCAPLSCVWFSVDGYPTEVRERSLKQCTHAIPFSSRFLPGQQLDHVFRFWCVFLAKIWKRELGVSQISHSDNIHGGYYIRALQYLLSTAIALMHPSVHDAEPHDTSLFSFLFFSYAKWFHIHSCTAASLEWAQKGSHTYQRGGGGCVCVCVCVNHPGPNT